MGLKTTNYEVKELGITLPNAYALLKKIKVDGDRGTAVFAIQTSREKVDTLSPIEIITTDFHFKRDENPVVTAYNTVKSQVTEKVLNQETGEYDEIVIPKPLSGWEDDIITE